MEHTLKFYATSPRRTVVITYWEKPNRSKENSNDWDYADQGEGLINQRMEVDIIEIFDRLEDQPNIAAVTTLQIKELKAIFEAIQEIASVTPPPCSITELY